MGYEVERFVKQVDEHLICPLCKKVFKDPTNCPEGHTFCKVCIDGWLQRPENYNTCPKDQKVHVIDKQALSRNYALCGVINNLEVFCHIPHELKTVTSDPDVIGAVQQTCDWTGKLQSLEKHRATCPFQQVQCSNVNCNRIMQRRELKDHEKRCDFRNVRCVECHFFLIEHELERHKENDCPETLVPCPNQCTNITGQVEKIKRKNTESHIINICARTIVDCPYKDKGCSVQVERQDVEKHVQENIAAHMMLLAKQCSFLTKQNSSLTVQNSSLAEQCSSLTKKCSSLTEQCSSLTEQCSALTEQCSALTEQCSALAKEVKAHLSSANTYTWVIYDFPALCDKHPNGSHFTSPIFWLRGYKLSLKIYPNGFGTDVSEFISLYLNLHEEYPDSSKKVTKVPNSESAIKFSQEVLQDPRGCKDGHAFCNECITVWLKTNQKCPLDNKPLQANNLVHILVVKNMIDSLNVYCHPPENERPTPYRENYYRYSIYDSPRTLRCEWTGKLESLDKHRETCPFQQVQCTNENCTTKIKRRELRGHDKICKYKKVECECNLTLIRHELAKHRMKDCPEVLVLCPNKCTSPQGQNNQIKRKNLNHHLTNICAKTIVDCPYKDQGCSVQVERQDVEKHVQENMAAHMMLLAKRCSFLAEQNAALKDQLSSANTYTWIIYDFPALCDKHPNGSKFRSPTFWLCGYKLCLWIYPDGDIKDSSGFISLFMNLHEEYSDTFDKDTSVPNSEFAIKWRLSMISQEPDTQDVSFEATHVFKKPEARGWPKFVKRTDALSVAYCKSTNGSLTIKCTILLDKP